MLEAILHELESIFNVDESNIQIISNLKFAAKKVAKDMPLLTTRERRRNVMMITRCNAELQILP
jgi:hypothetical protein